MAAQSDAVLSLPLSLHRHRCARGVSASHRSNLDTAGKESIDKQDVATSLASQGVGTYDQVRETLKEVQVDATCVCSITCRLQ